MTTTEIWRLLNKITPNKPVYGLACSMASLDTQTVIDLIEKWKYDQSLTQKELKNELSKQKVRKMYDELKTVLDANIDVHNVNS